MVEVGSHPFFRREGDNIRMDLPITLDEAVRGAKVKCPTVDGAVMLTVILFRCMKGLFKPDHHFGFEAVAWYWHFVDVVWLGLFLFVYVLV